MPMQPVKVRVDRWEREALQAAARSRDGRSVRRAQIILMTKRGIPVREIAAATGYTEEGVRVVKHRWNERGKDALKDAQRPGRPPKATPEYRARLREVAAAPPAKFGYAFGVWTVARLGEHMKSETDIELSDDRVRVLLHAAGLSWKRPAHTTKNLADSAEYARAKRRISRLKKGA